MWTAEHKYLTSDLFSSEDARTKEQKRPLLKSNKYNIT